MAEIIRVQRERYVDYLTRDRDTYAAPIVGVWPYGNDARREERVQYNVSSDWPTPPKSRLSQDHGQTWSEFEEVDAAELLFDSRESVLAFGRVREVGRHADCANAVPSGDFSSDFVQSFFAPRDQGQIRAGACERGSELDAEARGRAGYHGRRSIQTENFL